MRKLFTKEMAQGQGITPDALRWGVKSGKWVQVARGVYAEGAGPVGALDEALALLLVTGGVASHWLAGALYELDSIEMRVPFLTVPAGKGSDRIGVSRRDLDPSAITSRNGYACTTGLQTLTDLASYCADAVWEQILESALRKKLFMAGELFNQLPALGERKTPGVQRMRRVLLERGLDVPATGSILETLAVQLIRTHTSLPKPQRQVEVINRFGEFVAFPDLSWPEVGLFLELDGRQHLNQREYDARRETAIVAAKGWLPGRFTWREVVYNPRATARRMEELYGQARFRSGLSA